MALRTPSDADAHFDLGLAYAGMGLHEEAIGELTLAAIDPRRAAACLAMIAAIAKAKASPPDPQALS